MSGDVHEHKRDPGELPPAALGVANPATADAQVVPASQVAIDAVTGQAVAIGEGAQAQINYYSEIIVSLDSIEDVPPATGEPPFKGLAYYSEKDADLFCGREALTEKLVTRLRTTHFLALVGVSGSGKSSLLRAGVVPALRRYNWQPQLITPAASPLQQLAATLTEDDPSLTAADEMRAQLAGDPQTLRRAAEKIAGRHDAERFLLVVDQFEELFTLCEDEGERQTFIANLLAAAGAGGPTVVLIGLRADFYHRCLDYQGLRELVAAQQEPVAPLNQEELVRAIAEPARRGGWRFVEGLVEQIVQDVGEEPGRLPLLSHALLETWQRRRGVTMTLGGYRAAGGVEGAIAQTAERTFQQFDPAQAAIAEEIFLGLAELGDGIKATRRIASQERLRVSAGQSAQFDKVLQTLVTGRLVVVGEGRVEVAHEALIHRWPRLQAWLEENRERLRVERQLLDDARTWETLGRDEGALYRGARLAETQQWVKGRMPHLDELSAAFLQTSEQVAAAELRRRQMLQSIRSLLVGQYGGAVGFAVAFFVIYLDQPEGSNLQLLAYISALRTIPGAIGGGLLTAGLGWVRARSRPAWQRTVEAGLGGAAAFALALAIHVWFRVETASQLSGVVLAALAGALWGFFAGAGLFYLLSSKRPLWQTLPPFVLLGGAVLLLVEPLGNAFGQPQPLSLWLGGAILSLALGASMLLVRGSLEESNHEL